MSSITASRLIGKPQFRRLTGVQPDIFRHMVKRLQPSWDRQEAAKKRSGRPHDIGGLEEHLLLLLIIYRCHLTQDFYSLLFGVDKGTISRSLKRIEKPARRVLGVTKSIKVTQEEAHALLIDATEQPIQRPQRGQKPYYSGKKKQHTMKNEVVTSELGRIISASHSAPGSEHDLTLRRRGPPLPQGARGYADSGYQGYQNDHPDLDIPYKTSKNHQLTEEEKAYNSALSSIRVRAEHAIRRIKIFCICSEQFRYPRASHSTKFAIVAGIANLVAGF